MMLAHATLTGVEGALVSGDEPVISEPVVMHSYPGVNDVTTTGVLVAVSVLLVGVYFLFGDIAKRFSFKTEKYGHPQE